MNNFFKSSKRSSFVLMVFIISLLLPFKQTSAQQRSTYDLAAWVIGAVYDYDTATINLALKQGADINFKRAGSNALEMAMFYKKPAIFKFLLQKGASIDSINQDGMNALQYAEKIDNAEILQIIRSYKNANSTTSNTEINPKPVVEINEAVLTETIPLNKRYKVGDIVLHSRDNGKKWETGYIKEISTNKRLLADGISPYLVENTLKTSQNYLDTNYITSLTRQSSWTSFFVGDWNLQNPFAGVTRIIGNDVYNIYNGGEKLPPIRINANGTYSWVIDKKKVIKGNWIPNTDAPGIILVKGYRDVNWLAYNTSNDDNRKIFKKDYIIISDANGLYLEHHGFRMGKK